MKNLNDYLAMPYSMEIVEDKDEGGYVVSFPDLPGCITCGDTIESAVANGADAKKAWLEAALEYGLDIPKQKSALLLRPMGWRLRSRGNVHYSVASGGFFI